MSPSGSGSSPRRRGRVLIPTILVLAALIVLLVIFTSFYTDFLWFQSMDSSEVYTLQLGTRVGLFLGFGAVMAIAVGVSMWIAYRTRPMQRFRTAEQLSLERYRAGLEPLRKPLAIIVPLVLGVLGGISAAAEWRTWSAWRNQVPFGQVDPQFGYDISFYTFSYPWLRFVLGFAFAMVLLSLITAIVVHYLYGGLRLQPPSPRVSAAAQTQISILIGLFCVLKAVAYWLDRFGLALKSEDLVQGFTGLKYRDINALLPAKSILMVIALICAALFFFNAFRRSWPVAGASLALLVVSALVIGGIYPAIVQQFQVKPSEVAKEAQSISDNIAATRSAYDIDNVKVSVYNASKTPDQAVLATQTSTLDSIRIVDPSVVSPTFRALQQGFGFYSFPDSLDVDRYAMNGGEQGSVVSVRELNLDGVPSGQRNWANDHLVYTHGYGFVAAYDNRKTSNGEPEFFESNIPPQGSLQIDQPRVYFGESSPTYSIVGGSPDGTARELDYPDDQAPNRQRNNTYDGTGGVPVGSPFNRLLFAIKYQEPNILLSDLINDQSKIMWDRDPETIVSKVAPFLRLDSDPYPVVVGGRIKWIVDGYTTSNSYPFSSRTTLSDAISDSTVARGGPATALPRDQINYIRNSVKAVVDAYDGSVDLYSWDDSDPVLQTWENVFPGLVKPKSAMPADLMAHVRYPEDIFKIQRAMFARYHVTDPASFYNGQDFWNVPIDPTNPQENQLQPPYYLQLQMPGQTQANFSLTTTFAPVNRQTLAAFMSVDSTPGPDYGQMQVLQLPSNVVIPGPVQVQNNFDSTFANDLNLLRQTGTEVEFGNLLSLPVGGGMLYVEPLYVKGAANGFPLLQDILVSFGDKSSMKPTLTEALQDVGVIPGTAPKPDSGGKVKPTPPEKSLLEQLSAALDAAQKAYNDGQTALKNGDFAAYGKAQKRLADELAKAQTLQQQLLNQQSKGSASAADSSAAPSASAASASSGSPSAGASPSPGISPD